MDFSSLILLFLFFLFLIWIVNYKNKKEDVQEEKIYLDFCKNLILSKPQNIKLPTDKVFNIKIIKNGVSHTSNKQTINLLIADKNGNIFNEKTLTSVLIHELAHILDYSKDSESHGESFKEIEKELILRYNLNSFSISHEKIGVKISNEYYPCK